MSEYVRSSLPRYGRVPRALLRDPNLSAQAVRLYGILDDYAGADGQAFPSRATLASPIGSTAAVDRAKRELEDGGWLIRSQRRRPDGGQTSTLFTLTDGPIPSSPATTPLITGDDPPSSPVMTQEGTPVEGQTPLTPHGGDDVDVPLIPVAPVGGVVHTGDMSTPATTSRRRPTVTDADPAWSAFWSAYPRKLGKGAARKAWARAITKADTALILNRTRQFANDVDRRVRTERAEPGRDPIAFVPYPATWLNQERWDDEKQDVRSRAVAHPPRKDEECPTHPGNWKDACRGCAADAKAKD